MFKINGYFFYEGQKRKLPDQDVANIKDLQDTLKHLGIDYYFFTYKTIEEEVDTNETEEKEYT